jgi:UDP-N-acetylglucosamine 2-epimerase (non-hydrolysing)
MGAIEQGYVLVTLHRPSNVDVAEVLAGHVQALLSLANRLPVLWPVHPRARAQLERFGLWGPLNDHPNIACLPPQGYFEMVGLLRDATLVLTDSGGVQEETTALGVPCLTLRESTERPVTVTQGTNRLVVGGTEAVLAAAHAALDGDTVRGRIPDGWDGASAQRLSQHLLGALQARHSAAFSA